MIKINPVKLTLNPEIIKKINSTTITKPSFAPQIAAVGTCGVILSTFFKDYKSTVEEDNCFQFKPGLKPDVFQNAAAQNLYLSNDVLVTAPTGTGKTAIAQYVMSKNLNEGKRTFYTTPLKALSNEKFLSFSKMYGKENVGLLTGDSKINTNAPIIVMTTEVYRNMVASNLFNTGNIPDTLKTVIFDELQYLGDIDRGGIWEQSIMYTPKNVQILSLSATIGNNEEINNWIASVKHNKPESTTPDENYKPVLDNITKSVLINVPPQNRHVPLNYEIEHAVAEIKIPRGGSKAEKIKAQKKGARLSQSIYAKPKDDNYKTLTKKLNAEGKLPAIYFVFSKKECRHLLKLLSTESEILTTEDEQKEISNIIKRYKREGIYLGESLDFDALKKGYAIHNAGLLPNQKLLVEELFQKKLVKVVLATETLSAGINMPAKTTVISSPRKPASTSDGGDDKKRNLTPNEFHQMAGRAGRRGIDTVGYCYSLSCNPEQTKLYNELMASPSNRLDSNLDLDFSFIANYVSEFDSDDELEYLLSKSFYAFDKDKEELMDTYRIKKEILENEGFVRTNKMPLLRLINGYEQIPIINILTNGTLDKLNPVQIAGIVGGLANIEYNTKGEFPQKPFDVKEQADEAFVDASYKVNSEVKRYDKLVDKLYPARELSVSAKVMDHLYAWASMNEKDEDSKENWKNLYTGDMRFSIRDEGTLFKEITMTIDLLKQMVDISDEAGNSELSNKLRQALVLIEKEPCYTGYYEDSEIRA